MEYRGRYQRDIRIQTPQPNARTPSNSSTSHTPPRHETLLHTPPSNRHHPYTPSRDGNHSYTPSGGGNHSYTPSRGGNHSYTPSRDGNHSYTPSRDGNHSYTPSRGGNHSYTPSGGGNHLYTPSRDGNHSYTPSRDGNHLYTPSRDGNHSYTSSRDGNHSYTPSRDGNRSYTPSGDGNRSYTPSGGGNHSYTPSGGGNHLYTPSRDGNHSYTPSGGGNHLYTPSGGGNHSYTPSGDGNHLYTPSRDGNHLYTPSRDGNHSYTPSRGGNHLYTPSRDGNYSYTPSRNGNNSFRPSRDNPRRSRGRRGNYRGYIHRSPRNRTPSQKHTEPRHKGTHKPPRDKTPPPTAGAPGAPTTQKSLSPQEIYRLKYLDGFLLPHTEEGHERILPTKILNTRNLFCKILKMESHSTTEIFNQTLTLLTSPALCDVKYRASEAVGKVHKMVNKEMKMPLEHLTYHNLFRINAYPESSCRNKIDFETQLLRLIESYSINDLVINILNILKEDLIIEGELKDGKIDAKYSDSIQSIHTDIETVIKHGSRNYDGIESTLSQFISSMLPTPCELLEDRPVMPHPLIIRGEYANTQSFLYTHYNLLREDMVRPLRRGISEYLNGDKQARKSLYFYDEAKFLYPECDLNQGLMYRVKFNVSGVRDVSRIKWDRCERLKFGTLLCIVKVLDADKPCFQEILWGIVSNRDARSLQNNLEISIKFPSGFEPRVDFSQTYMMLESREVYFESYCHTLSVLHSMEQLPFTDVLLGKSLVCAHPQYLKENTLFDLSPIFPDREEALFPCLGKWPDNSPKLDESQYKALRLALTREVSLIQGPPGTGKTYVGAIALEILLQTKHSYYLHLESQLFDDPVVENPEPTVDTEAPDLVNETPTQFTSDQGSFMSTLESPILILTYTNHALDQFLMLLLRFESKIVRIGSKVEQDELLPHCLTELRKKLLPSRNERDKNPDLPLLPQYIYELKRKRDNLKSTVFKLKDKMSKIRPKLTEKEITFHEVYSLCTKDQSDSIRKVPFSTNVTNEDKFAYWRDGGENHSNYSIESVKKESPKPKPKHEPTTEDVHSASDDEDNVDGKRIEDGYEDFRECIVQWDNLYQVLSEYEMKQLKDKLPGIPDRVKSVKNLWSLSKGDRDVLYKHWLDLKQQVLLLMVEEISEQFSVLCADIEELNRSIDICILREAAVVGMTTTGAARNSQLIRQLNPRIVVVEEAAEVLEAHIIANLTPEVQHLVLIGDHQQLRPSNAEFELTKHSNLDVSLFERLIKNGVEHVTLHYQHRMSPEISSLVRHIYPKLEDHEVVLSHDIVYGVKENIFFIDHDIAEDHADQDTTTTKTHKYEARYLSRLAKYLVDRGYRTDEITILTFYQGQKFCILDELRKLGIRLRVSTVDKYQGEENRVILFSVVRSNRANNIGHCKIDNRVCVALSRAKDGLFMIGNATSLRNASKNTKSDLWNKVLDTFGDSRVSKTFPLICNKHPESWKDIDSPEEFDRIDDGLCKLPCNEQLDCRHKCTHLCHYNKKIQCKEFCDRINPDCGHPCLKENGEDKKLCYERCGKCNFSVLKKLFHCDHETILPCHFDTRDYNSCQEVCEKEFECGHPCVREDGEKRKLCYERCGKCNYFVNKQLKECGHERMLPCHVYPHHNLCEKPCNKTRDCGHQCEGMCGQMCHQLKCRVKVDRELPCTHKINMKCSDTVDVRKKCHQPCLKVLKCSHQCSRKCYEICESLCMKPCERERMCGHPCEKLCWEDCGPCLSEVEKIVEECNHKMKLKCSVEPSHDLCDKPCKLALPCEHACERKCNENCIEIPCKQIVMKYCSCGHHNEMPCYFDSDNFECTKPCLLPLPCGHICPLTCDKDCEDAVCGKPCERKYECGHLCFDKLTGEPKACSDDCGQCIRSVLKKLQGCGHEIDLPCFIKPLHPLCLLPCEKKKKCGHTCTGSCGQNCDQIKCKEKVKKELACKHVKEMKCCAKTDSVRCLEKCTKSLKCGHHCTQKCSEDCITTLCKVSLTKEHSCGHTSTYTCHEGQTNSILHCTEPCPENLTCGHKCTGDCGDECSEIVCQVKERLQLNCGHTITFICSKSQKYFENSEHLKHVIHCKEQDCKLCIQIKSEVDCKPCTVKSKVDSKPCEVKSKVDSKPCTVKSKVDSKPCEVKSKVDSKPCEVRSKVQGNKKCGKSLNCGHKCQEKSHNPTECSPCRELCSSQCIHSKCPLHCGDVCTKCEEGCEWECKHHSCPNKCWEPCDRPVCNEMCPLPQNCGHPCLGLCGEICPEICDKCDSKNDLFKENVGPFIILDCSHIFPVNILDQYFETIREHTSIPACSKCKEPIYKTYRYGNIIKRIMMRRSEEKSDRQQRTLIHITNECKRVFNPPSPLSQPLTKFFGIIDRIKLELANYQLTKLYTILDLLGVLAGMANHHPDVWTSSDHHTKFLQSRTLSDLIGFPTNSDDSEDIDWIRKLATRCELCSIFSVIKTGTRHKSLTSQDGLFLKDSYQTIFLDEPHLGESKCGVFLEDLGKFVSKYDVDHQSLVKYHITRPQVEQSNGDVTQTITHKIKTECSPPISRSKKINTISFCDDKSSSAATSRGHSLKEIKIKKEVLISKPTKRSVPSSEESKSKLPRLSPRTTKSPRREIRITTDNARRVPSPSRKPGPLYRSRPNRRFSRRRNRRYK